METVMVWGDMGGNIARSRVRKVRQLHYNLSQFVG